jgi:hypothetical protein
LSELFQKSFISVREFVESWDKELYELNNLDFFIYLMINHLGNQLEQHYFIREKEDSQLFLDYDSIGTVCFNIGDAFEFFLEENCLGNCPLNCPRDLEGRINLDNVELEDKIKRKLLLLQSFMAGELDKEQCLRIDLLNHVIIDTLIHFYHEELQLEVNEEDISLMDLAEFIEDNIIEYLKFEGQPLLQRPFETALDYFEDMLQAEADEESENSWYEDEDNFEPEEFDDDWQHHTESISDVFRFFITDEYYNPPGSNVGIVHDINFFKKYLLEYANIKNISQLDEGHLGEFFSVWLVKEFVMADETQIPHIFRTVARFVTYLYHKYNLNLKREFLRYYDALKLDLPRVVRAINAFISEYDLLEAILSAENPEFNRFTGFYEVVRIRDRQSRIFDIRDINSLNSIEKIKLDSPAFSSLKKGDILYASVVEKEDRMEIDDIQFIYPNMAKDFIDSFAG